MTAISCPDGDYSTPSQLKQEDWSSVYPEPAALVPVKLRDGRLIWAPPGTKSPTAVCREYGIPLAGEQREPYKDPFASSPECGAWALEGECGNNHAYAKQLFCGKEWCPRCGEKWSWSHQRRFARWLPKARQMSAFGYFVIEWPKNSRHKLRSKAALSEYGKRIKGAMVALGYKRGLRRWHYFGDKGATRGYNPHLNVIVDGRFLDSARLERVKGYLRQVLDEPQLIVHYSYRRSTNMMVHALKYVLRATFREESWDPEMAARIWNFQNTNTWGTWREDPVWSLDGQDAEAEVLQATASFEQGLCPDCGLPISWGSKVVGWSPEIARAQGAELIGAGYYRLPDRPPKPPPETVEARRLALDHGALRRAGAAGIPVTIGLADFGGGA